MKISSQLMKLGCRIGCTALALLLACGHLALAHSPKRAQAAENGASLSTFVRPDGKTECYYAAGNVYLAKSFELLDEYWSDPSRARYLTGHSDTFLPIQFKQLGHKPAEAMMRGFADYFFAQADSKTGLIPFPYAATNPESGVTSGGQPVSLIVKTVEILDWFPEDATLRQKAVALGDATLKHFEAGAGKGVHYRVEIDGTPVEGERVKLQRISEMMLGMYRLHAALSAHPEESDDPTGLRFRRFADEKLEFLWSRRWPGVKDPETGPFVLADFFTATEPFPADNGKSDTDVLYFLRDLYEIHRLCVTHGLPPNPRHRDIVLKVTDSWNEHAWNGDYGHFVRKLNPDETPADDRLYGDGKWNLLQILINAWDLRMGSPDRHRLRERFKESWDGLLRAAAEGGDASGLMPEMVTAGRYEPTGEPSPEQTVFLQAVLRAYELSRSDPELGAMGDVTLADRARRFGEAVLAAGPPHWRMQDSNAGTAFLQLALIDKDICRLEVEMPAPGTQLTLFRSAGGEPLLQVVVPGDVAVIYLPTGSYDVRLSTGGAVTDRHYEVWTPADVTVP